VTTLGGVYVGVLAVALLRFVRSRERRLVPVMVLFALLAVAQTREEWQWSRPLWHLAAGLAGLAVVFTVAPHPPTRTH